jgi:hypothetical protein
MSTLAGLALWVAITLGLWMLALASTRGAQRVPFTLLAVCVAITTGFYASKGHRGAPDLAETIVMLLFLGAIATDLWLNRTTSGRPGVGLGHVFYSHVCGITRRGVCRRIDCTSHRAHFSGRGLNSRFL